MRLPVPYLFVRGDRPFLPLIDGIGDVFVAGVRKARGKKLSGDANIATGEVWLGPEARALGLVDEMGTLEEVVRKRGNSTPTTLVLDARAGCSR